MLSARFREHSNRLTTPLASALAETGVAPNSLTLLGLLLSFFAAAAFAVKAPLLAFFALLLAGMADALDGALARALERTTKFGGFLDSTIDRYSDAVILAGVGMYMEVHLSLVLFALSGSLLVSYSRARAELAISKCDVGLAERAERMIILSAAAFLTSLEIADFNFLYIAVALVAVLTHVTLLQRINYTRSLLTG